MHRINKALLSTLFISGIVVNTTQPISFFDWLTSSRVYQSAAELCTEAGETAAVKKAASLCSSIADSPFGKAVKAHPRIATTIAVALPTATLAYVKRQQLKTLGTKLINKIKFMLPIG